ncbi:hypothetical protein GWK47_001504 [Chionoecetes opilio]|uniref:Tumor protein p53-inducible nuclear protein 2 n=1 Tax=Chionoecetes opilio TaxID=41210 RepID=A0A8J4XXS3_CHIOP|nr:hypothetical protein GWK47_001504 [Chionoecetes opilio]
MSSQLRCGLLLVDGRGNQGLTSSTSGEVHVALAFLNRVIGKMLANLTSLIWGSGNTPATDATTTTTVMPSPGPITTKDAYEDAPEDLPKFNIRATTPTDEEEADWVLVDRAASPSSQSTLMEREDSSMKENTSEEVENQVAEAPPPRGIAQRAPSLLRAIDVLRPAQKAQRRREERRLKRSTLERNNKVREVASAGNKRAKRCDLMAPGKFSRAVNNRKC